MNETARAYALVLSVAFLIGALLAAFGYTILS